MICKAYRAFYRVRNEYIEVLRIVMIKQDYMKILFDLAGQVVSDGSDTTLHAEYAADTAANNQHTNK